MEHLPVFVRITGPKDVRELIHALKSDIEETRATLENIKVLTDEESSKISEWKSNFQSLNEDIINASSTLLKPEKI